MRNHRPGPGDQQQAAKLLGVSEVNFSGLGEQSLLDAAMSCTKTSFA